MKTIDVLGKPCPIPVIEAKKVLTGQSENGVLVKVDNIIAVQNLEKMANGYGYSFSYVENAKDSYEVTINKDGEKPPKLKAESGNHQVFQNNAPTNGFAVAISRNTMGEGAEELGKILIKGYIYSLAELPTPPKFVIFFNSGAYLTSEGANTIDDLKKLEQKGAEILTCGTCVNYYGLQDKLAVGTITDMYGIAERMASVGNVINI